MISLDVGASKGKATIYRQSIRSTEKKKKKKRKKKKQKKRKKKKKNNRVRVAFESDELHAILLWPIDQ